MKLISCHDGKLHALDAGIAGAVAAGSVRPGRQANAFRTGLALLDDLPPGRAFARGAVHELIHSPGEPPPLFLAGLLARCAGEREQQRGGKGTRRQGDSGTKDGGHSVPWSPCLPVPLSPPAPPPTGAIVWSAPSRELSPPALAALGIPLERVFLLHPASEADQVWALTECLRCRGV